MYQTNTIALSSYSLNPDDEQTLKRIAEKLHALTQQNQAALIISALYDAFEPSSVYVDYGICRQGAFDECIILIQHLSTQGKIDLVRGIAELLATENL